MDDEFSKFCKKIKHHRVFVETHNSVGRIVRAIRKRRKDVLKADNGTISDKMRIKRGIIRIVPIKPLE